jgi:hydroxymethylbilane synthase
MAAEIRLATRRSALALWQANRVADRLRAVDGTLDVTLVEIDASGDLDRISPVATLTEMGAFVRSVQIAVLDGRADAAVHSLKDLPTTGPDGLALVAFPERATPWDAIVGSTLTDLPPGAVIGTGSPRRISQLHTIRPDLVTVELRGNVGTRLAKVADGTVDAAILAAAGLERLGHADRITELLGVATMIPAPGQGVLAVETAETHPHRDLFASIDDPDLRPLVEAERGLLVATGAGCRSALGAIASWDGTAIRMDAFADENGGPRRVTVTEATPDRVVDAVRKGLGL